MLTPWKFGEVGHYPIGSLFVVLIALLSQVLPSTCIDLQTTSDLKCFECTNENPDCEETAFRTVKDCGPDAIGCGIYAFYYDFFVGKVLFHRSCIYSYDAIKPNWQGSLQMLELDDRGYYTQTGESYQALMELWTEVRRRADSSIPVVQVKHAPIGVPGVFKFHVHLHQIYGTNNNNGESFRYLKWPGFKTEETPFQRSSIQCYSCEFEIKGSRIFAHMKAPNDFPSGDATSLEYPPCSSKDASPLKKVTCKNAYGCATFVEMKNASNAMYDETGFFYREDTNTSMARVWRGCWYPGDQVCLRYPEKSTGRSLRSGSKGDMGTDQCTAAYKRSYETEDGVVVWAGAKAIESSEEYNKYLKCRHEVREGVNVQSELKLVEDKIDKEYIWIQYLFCGPKSKCNKYVEHRYYGEAGKEKYNQKDYEDADGKDAEDEIKKNATVTKFDNCTEVKVKDKEKGAGYSLGGCLLNILLFSAAHFIFLV